MTYKKYAGPSENDELDLTHYTEWCDYKSEMVYTTCHRSCEGCMSVCPGPHYPAAIIFDPKESQ